MPLLLRGSNCLGGVSSRIGSAGSGSVRRVCTPSIEASVKKQGTAERLASTIAKDQLPAAPTQSRWLVRTGVVATFTPAFVYIYWSFGKKFNANLSAFLDPVVEDLKKDGVVAQIVGAIIVLPVLLVFCVPIAIVKTALQSSVEAGLYMVPVAYGHTWLFATREAKWSLAMKYLGSASLPVFVGIPLYVATGGELSGWIEPLLRLFGKEPAWKRIPKLLSEEEMQAREEEEIASYQKADTFEGVKEGYIFKKGPLGLGYYRDVNSPDYVPAPRRNESSRKATKANKAERTADGPNIRAAVVFASVTIGLYAFLAALLSSQSRR